MLPDVDGLALLDPAQLKAGWERDRRADREPLQVHRRPEGQGEGAARAEQRLGRRLVQRLRQPRGAREVPARARRRSRRPSGTRTPCPTSASGPGRRGGRSRRDRKKLTAPLVAEGPGTGRRGRSPWRRPSSRPSAGAYAAPWTFLDVANLLTMYGLVRDRRLPDPRVPDPPGRRLRGGLPGDDLSLHAALAGLAPQSQDRGALLDRQQEPGRADRLPARSPSRPAATGSASTRSSSARAAAAAGRGTSGKLAEKYGITANGSASSVDPRKPVHVATRS